MRDWRDRDSRDSRFWNSEREREVRVVGRRIMWLSSEKEVACGNMAPIERILREGSLVSPHWDRGLLIFSQSSMTRDLRRVKF